MAAPASRKKGTAVRKPSAGGKGRAAPTTGKAACNTATAPNSTVVEDVMDPDQQIGADIESPQAIEDTGDGAGEDAGRDDRDYVPGAGD
jgi:hypothetical protein